MKPVTTYEHLLALVQKDKDGALASETGRDPLVAGCSFLAICLTLMGDPERGEAAARRGLSHAEHLKHAISIVFALRRGCVEAMLRRDVERVKVLSARLLEVSADYETFLGGPEGHLFYSWALLHEHVDEALQQRMQRSLDQLDETRTWALLPFFMAAAAELRAAMGDHPAARKLLVRAQQLGEATGERWSEPEIMRLEAALLCDSTAGKLNLLYRALELSRGQGSRIWQLRIAMDLAEMLHDERRPDEAYTLLAPNPCWVQRRGRHAGPPACDPPAQNAAPIGAITRCLLHRGK